MNAFIISFVLLILSISSFSIMMYIVNSGDFTKLKNQPDCENPNINKKVGDSCGNWDGSQCRKGIIKNHDGKIQCEIKGSLLPMGLLIAGGFFFVMFIIYFVIGIKGKGKK